MTDKVTGQLWKEPVRGLGKVFPRSLSPLSESDHQSRKFLCKNDLYLYKNKHTDSRIVYCPRKQIHFLKNNRFWHLVQGRESVNNMKQPYNRSFTDITETVIIIICASAQHYRCKNVDTNIG